jgi:hypothetical protein
LKKKDISHSMKGIMAGLFLILLAALSLGLFYGLDANKKDEVRK